MNKLTVLILEWNCYNGFMFELFYLETYGYLNLDSSLFGVKVARNFLYIDLFWKNIKVFDLTDNNDGNIF